MISRINRYFIPPVFEHDEEKTARARLVFYSIVIEMLLYLAALTLPLFRPVAVGMDFYFAALAFQFVFFVISLALLLRRHVRPASIVLVASTWIFITALCIRGGGVRSNAYPGYIMVMTLAGLVLGRPGSIMTIIASISAGLLMVFAVQNGQIAPAPISPGEPLPLWLTTSFFLMGTAALQNTATRIINQTLKQARHELDERKRTEATLAREHDLLRTLINILPENIYVKDRQSRFLLNNKVSMSLLDITRQEDLTGKSDFDFYPPDTAEAWYKHEQDIMQSGKAMLEEESQEMRHGDMRWLVGSIIPLRDDSGQVIGVVGMNRDVTERKNAEEALRLSETRYRLLAENMPNSVVILYDHDLRLVLVDGPEIATAGYSTKEAMEGKTIYEVLPPDFAQAIEPNLRAALEGKTFSAELPFGDLFYRYNYVPLRNDQGEIVYGMILGQNITDRKKAEDALRQSEERLRAIISNMPIILFSLTPDGIFTLSEGKGLDLLRLKPGEVVGQSAFEYYKDMPHIREILHRALAGEVSRAIHDNGDVIFDAFYTPLKDEEGRIISVMGVAVDVTEQKRADDALRESEEVAREFQEKLRALHEVSLELSTTQTLDNLYYRAVELATQKLGFERLSLMLFDQDRTLRATYGTDETGAIRDERHLSWKMAEDSREVQLVREGLHAKYWADVNLKGAGEIVGRGWDALAVLWNGSEGIGFISTDNYLTQKPPRPYAVDLLGLYGSLLGNLITRKQTEATLRESEERYRTISELMSDYAFANDVLPDGSYDTNWITHESFTRLTGYQWDEIRTTYKLYHPDDVEAVRQAVNKTLRGEVSQGEFRIVTKSGEERWLYIRRQPEWDEEQQRVVRFYGVAQDITERKHLEAALQEYTQQLELRVEARTIELQRAKEQIEAILNSISDAIVVAGHTGTIQTTNPAFREMFGNRVISSIQNFLTVVPDQQQAKTIAEALNSVMTHGGTQRTEARVLCEDGRQIDIDLTLIAIHEQDSDHRSILLSAHDITYLKELERFKMQFVANAVHDLSSPITSLSTRLYLLKKTPERLPEHVRILEDQVSHMKELVVDLRTLSELDRGLVILNLETLNLNTLVAQVFQQYEPVAANKNLQMFLSLSSDQLLSRLDRRKCERIIVNLISNAINYTLQGGQIQVLTEIRRDAFIFSVEDQGIGIAKEDLPHIFERFYRADNAKIADHSGTGLGLSIVKEMVTAQGGVISVESEVNKGSRFTVSFPFQADVPDNAAQS